ncbi:hypothetical protein BX600DRAFT_429173 [Xylariales sp. PMI_506]|nr:hypothetical protein BX600DRAFT_429173 [Xylariales sp. PMI_506]
MPRLAAWTLYSNMVTASARDGIKPLLVRRPYQVVCANANASLSPLLRDGRREVVSFFWPTANPSATDFCLTPGEWLWRLGSVQGAHAPWLRHMPRINFQPVKPLADGLRPFTRLGFAVAKCETSYDVVKQFLCELPGNAMTSAIYKWVWQDKLPWFIFMTIESTMTRFWNR